MNIEFVGKFYDNHSLSIVNRNILLELIKLDCNIRVLALDTYDPEYKIDKSVIKIVKQHETTELTSVDIQLRHSYPPIWDWPEHSNTKIVYIQPWEYPKAPFEWQYKFETFADALIVPSNYCRNVFKAGGLNPSRLFTVPNGYNNKVFNTEDQINSVKYLGIDSSKFNFVYVGNSQWRKGLDILLNAWSTSFKKYDNACLIIKDNPKVYGHSNLLSEIVKLQFNTGCGEIVYIDENISEQNMADIYKASKVLVHPYRAEGFGMHVQEAMACGCIPIVSSNGPTDDFIPEGVGIKLPVTRKAINIQDPNIFAVKPGDATTLMSTHTFINEPVVEHVQRAMQHVYYNYESKYAKQLVAESLTDWSVVAKKYMEVFMKIRVFNNKRR
jgi:glycosyltransferase involved in cell wall biosynthesis